MAGVPNNGDTARGKLHRSRDSVQRTIRTSTERLAQTAGTLAGWAIDRARQGRSTMNERETRTLDELWEELEKARQAEREAERLTTEAEQAQNSEKKESKQ